MKPTPEAIAAHLAEGCAQGEACPFRKARDVLERPEPPTREELSELMMQLHFSEEIAKDVNALSDQKTIWLAAILNRLEAGEVLLTNAEVTRHQSAFVVVSPEDEGTLLKLLDLNGTRAATRGASRENN